MIHSDVLKWQLWNTMELFAGISTLSWVSTIRLENMDSLPLRPMPMTTNRAPKPCAAGNGDASRGLGDKKTWGFFDSGFCRLWWSGVSQLPTMATWWKPRFFSPVDLVKASKQWMFLMRKWYETIEHVQRLYNCISIWYVIFLGWFSCCRSLGRDDGISPTAVFGGWLVMFSFYLFFSRQRNQKTTRLSKSTILILTQTLATSCLRDGFFENYCHFEEE